MVVSGAMGAGLRSASGRLALFLALFGIISAAPPAFAESIGTVSDVKLVAYGTAPAGQRNVKSFRDSIVLREALETAPKGSLDLRFVDDTTLSLGGAAELVVDEMVYDPKTHQGSSVIKMMSGTFYWATGHMAKENIVIETPVATIGIRGTEFSVKIEDNGETSISVISGKVNLTSKITGRAVQIPAGNNSEVSSGGQLAQVAPGIKNTGDIHIDGVVAKAAANAAKKVQQAANGKSNASAEGDLNPGQAKKAASADGDLNPGQAKKVADNDLNPGQAKKLASASSDLNPGQAKKVARADGELNPGQAKKVADNDLNPGQAKKLARAGGELDPGQAKKVANADTNPGQAKTAAKANIIFGRAKIGSAAAKPSKKKIFILPVKLKIVSVRGLQGQNAGLQPVYKLNKIAKAIIRTPVAQISGSSKKPKEPLTENNETLSENTDKETGKKVFQVALIAEPKEIGPDKDGLNQGQGDVGGGKKQKLAAAPQAPNEIDWAPSAEAVPASAKTSLTKTSSPIATPTQSADTAQPAPKPVTVPAPKVTPAAPKPLTVAASKVTPAAPKPLTVAASKVTPAAPKPLTVTAPKVTPVAPKPLTVAAPKVTPAAPKPVTVAAPKVTPVAPKPVKVAAPKPAKIAAPKPVKVAAVSSNKGNGGK